ncbi:hypothetical protein IWQ61_009432, partial [Dispira simplex]
TLALVAVLLIGVVANEEEAYPPIIPVFLDHMTPPLSPVTITTITATRIPALL